MGHRKLCTGTFLTCDGANIKRTLFGTLFVVKPYIEACTEVCKRAKRGKKRTELKLQIHQEFFGNMQSCF